MLLSHDRDDVPLGLLPHWHVKTTGIAEHGFAGLALCLVSLSILVFGLPGNATRLRRDVKQGKGG